MLFYFMIERLRIFKLVPVRPSNAPRRNIYMPGLFERRRPYYLLLSVSSSPLTRTYSVEKKEKLLRRGWPEVTITKARRISPLHRQHHPLTENPAGNPTILPPSRQGNPATRNPTNPHPTHPRSPDLLRARPITRPLALVQAQSHLPELRFRSRTLRPWVHRLRRSTGSTCSSAGPSFSPTIPSGRISLSRWITMISLPWTPPGGSFRHGPNSTSGSRRR